MRELRRWAASSALLLALICPTAVQAEEGGEKSPATFGTYTPNSGFKLASTDQGELSLRIFTYVRYLNQLGLDAEYTDSFGQPSTLDLRHDIQFQKVVIYLQGWLLDPKFRYLTYVWTSNTSQGQGAQVIVAGSLSYVANPHATFGAGVDALPGVRATEGNFPFWLTVDNRLVADEYFRPSYTMGVWAKGEVVDRLTYRAMLGNNLSQLGVDAGQLDNKLNTMSLALIWLPTTGEFGTNGGFGDFDTHQKVATRLAAHYTTSTEDRQGAPNTDAFENVQIRLSDGNPIFTPDLFGAGVQVEQADYHMFCADGGVKLRGLSLEGEYFWRRVDGLAGPGTETLTFSELNDHGFQLQASGMLMPKQLQAYGGLSKIYGEYGDPWDLRFGVNVFPEKNHVLRWNTEYLYTQRSPVGGLSLPTLVGGTGDTFYSSFVVNF